MRRSAGKTGCVQRSARQRRGIDRMHALQRSSSAATTKQSTTPKATVCSGESHDGFWPNPPQRRSQRRSEVQYWARPKPCRPPGQEQHWFNQISVAPVKVQRMARPRHYGRRPRQRLCPSATSGRQRRLLRRKLSVRPPGNEAHSQVDRPKKKPKPRPQKVRQLLRRDSSKG